MVCFENITLNIPERVRCGAFAEKSDSKLVSPWQPSSPESCSAVLMSPSLLSCAPPACTTQVIRAKVRLAPADSDRLELD